MNKVVYFRGVLKRDAVETASVVFPVDPVELEKAKDKGRFLADALESFAGEHEDLLPWRPEGVVCGSEFEAWSEDPKDYRREHPMEYRKWKQEGGGSMDVALLDGKDRVVPLGLLEEVLDAQDRLRSWAGLLDQKVLDHAEFRRDMEFIERVARALTACAAQPEHSGSEALRDDLVRKLGQVYANELEGGVRDLEVNEERALARMREWIEEHAWWEREEDLIAPGVSEGQVELAVRKRMAAGNGTKMEPVVVVSRGEGKGAPVEMRSFRVAVNESQYALGEHYDLARALAREAGMPNAQVMFDAKEMENIRSARNTLMLHPPEHPERCRLVACVSPSGEADVVVVQDARTEDLAVQIAQGERYEPPFVVMGLEEFSSLAELAERFSGDLEQLSETSCRCDGEELVW